MSGASGEAAGGRAPPVAPGPIRLSLLTQVTGSLRQPRLAKQTVACPVCPPPPDAGAFTAQRCNVGAHLRRQHPTYTVLDGAEAAAIGCRSLGAFGFTAIPKVPATGVRAPMPPFAHIPIPRVRY